jgi:aminoglycoside/choline kinase family phosphotransferase
LTSQDALITFARESLGLSRAIDVQLLSFSERGSDRSYFRFTWAHANSAILVCYELSRIENSYFADIAAFLYENDIPVPKIIRHDAAARRVLMEDLGDIDLWSFRNSPWEERRKLYQRTIVAVHKLHSFPEQGFPSDRVKLMEAFGPALYHWERDYFKANFIKALCRIELKPASEQQLERELSGLAGRLSSGLRSLVHRDLQSQNVMIYREKPFLIDFQGMRFGSRFYDLGSLLCDPYVNFSGSERMELLYFYYELSRTEVGWGDFQKAFWEASAQRLMQALGAYGFLGLTKGLKDYLAHVPAGLRNLRTAAESAGDLPILLEICERCEVTIRDSKFEIRD